MEIAKNTSTMRQVAPGSRIDANGLWQSAHLCFRAFVQDSWTVRKQLSLYSLSTYRFIMVPNGLHRTSASLHHRDHELQFLACKLLLPRPYRGSSCCCCTAATAVAEAVAAADISATAAAAAANAAAAAAAAAARAA